MLFADDKFGVNTVHCLGLILINFACIGFWGLVFHHATMWDDRQNKATAPYQVKQSKQVRPNQSSSLMFVHWDLV